jgi:hypothetical protein
MTYPAQPIEYGVPRAGRPGVVTAVGVLSIILGSLSALAGLWGVLTYGVMLFAMRTAPATPMPMPPAATMPATTPSFGATGTTTVSVGTWTTSTMTVNASAGGGGATAGAVVMPPMVNPFAGVSPIALWGVVLTSSLGVLLGAALLILGVTVLRDSRAALEMHRWYVRLKVPLVLLSTAATLWLNWSMAKNMTAMMAATPTPAGATPYPQWGDTMMFAMMSITTVFWLLVGLAYPIALFFVLRSRTVREYCSDVR